MVREEIPAERFVSGARPRWSYMTASPERTWRVINIELDEERRSEHEHDNDAHTEEE